MKYIRRVSRILETKYILEINGENLMMITNKVTAFIIIGNNRNGELEVTYGKGIYNIRNFYYFSTGYLVQFSNKIE